MSLNSLWGEFHNQEKQKNSIPSQKGEKMRMAPKLFVVRKIGSGVRMGAEITYRWGVSNYSLKKIRIGPSPETWTPSKNGGLN